MILKYVWMSSLDEEAGDFLNVFIGMHGIISNYK